MTRICPKIFLLITVSTLLIMSLVILALSERDGNSESLGGWSQTTSYPQNVYQHSCVSSSNNIFCVGGTVNGSTDIASVYFAGLSSNGISYWNKTTSYPIPVDSESCVTYLSFIFCIAGYSSGTYPNSIFYSPTSSNGLGAWSPTVSYPTRVYGLSCVVSNGYVYCVGGYNGIEINNSYYAQLSSSGGIVGGWMQTTSYPMNIAFQSCLASNGYIYCFAGSSTGYSQLNYTNAVFYAPISASGIGQWKNATKYPLQVIGMQCLEAFSVAYCIGGENNSFVDKETAAVYSAYLSRTGVGNWSIDAGYPQQVVDNSCVTQSAYLYCVAGAGATFLNEAYFARAFRPQAKTTVGCTPGSTTVGSSVSCVAIVSGTNPSGVVTWSTNGSSSSFNSTTCTLSTSESCADSYTPMNAGSFSITASYGGDANNSQSTGIFLLKVVPATSQWKSSVLILYALISAAVLIAGAITIVVFSRRRV